MVITMARHFQSCKIDAVHSLLVVAGHDELKVREVFELARRR